MVGIGSQNVKYERNKKNEPVLATQQVTSDNYIY
jgi:hypothetical protein